MDNFFISEFQYTEDCIPEYLKRWWSEKLMISYILTALIFLYFLSNADNTEKFCLSVSRNSSGAASAAHKDQSCPGSEGRKRKISGQLREQCAFDAY